MPHSAQSKPGNTESLIRRTFELARLSAQKGNHPFGALLLIDNQIVLESENTVVTDKDHTSHAEYNLIHAAEKKFEGQIPEGAILVTSTEPCVMCAGALYWAGIRTIIFGCSAETLQKIAGRTLALSAKEVFKDSANEVTLIGPLLEEEGKKIHQDFWPNYSWKAPF